jgi:brefeldin A-inhibited guanine nucleotide-exchange protein
MLIGAGISTPKDVAKWLLATESLKKDKIGEYLGEKNDFNLQALQYFIEALEFKGVDFEQCLRAFLNKLRLPGEAQKIDRMMERFANYYCTCNPAVFKKQDAAYLLAFALIMLNTDAHNPAIKNKMSKAAFIKNSQFSEDASLPTDVLFSRELACAC